MTKTYVCVHIAEFPAQALVRLRSDLARSPVVVLQGEAPLEQVFSANSRGRRLGVRHGMTRTELDSFSGLTILRRSLMEEQSSQAALLDAAGRFTPRVEVQGINGSAWAIVLDMTGTDRIFGPVEQAIRCIQQAMKTLRFSVRVAASSNLHAAVCMAPYAMRAPVVIPDGGEAQALARLPLAALGLTTQQAEALELWGLRNLGELAQLPEIDLIVRLGQSGKRLRQLSRGECSHLMVPVEPAFALQEFLELDSPVETLDPLLFVISQLIGQLIVRAQTHAYALASVTVRLGLDGGGEHERTIKPALPLCDRNVLLKLLHLDLQAHPPSAGVISVFASAEPGDRSKVQLGLWSPQLPEPTRLDVTLARIAALVGEDRVGCAVLQDTHRPESFRMKRFMIPTSSGKNELGAGHSIALRRCRPPVPIRVRHDGAKLAGFLLNGTFYRVQQAYGPWRKSGDWWSSQMWSCEEWDVQAIGQGNSLLCVISHDLLGQQWRLEAMYD